MVVVGEIALGVAPVSSGRGCSLHDAKVYMVSVIIR
jgi:hypothetical protein